MCSAQAGTWIKRQHVTSTSVLHGDALFVVSVPVKPPLASPRADAPPEVFRHRIVRQLGLPGESPPRENGKMKPSMFQQIGSQPPDPLVAKTSMPAVASNVDLPANALFTESWTTDALNLSSGPAALNLSSAKALFTKSWTTDAPNPEPNPVAAVNVDLPGRAAPGAKPRTTEAPNPDPRPVEPSVAPPVSRRPFDARAAESPKPKKTVLPSVHEMTVHNMEQICRTSVQAAVEMKHEKEHAICQRRLSLEKELKHRARKKAAAWREMATKKTKEESVRKLEQQRRAEEERRREQELESKKKSRKMCSVAWNRILARLDRRADAATSEVAIQGASTRVDKRIAAYRLRALELKREERRLARIQAQEDDFQALPEARREAFERALSLHDEDDSGFLDPHELPHALEELGVRGTNQDEKHLVVQICEAATRRRQRLHQGGPAACTAVNLAVDIVPSIHKAFARLRLDALEEWLAERGLHEDDEAGHITPELLMQAAQAIWAFDQESEEADPYFRVSTMKDVQKACQHFANKSINLHDFCARLSYLLEEEQQNVAIRTRDIQEEHAIPDDLFTLFRPEILSLDLMFRQVDADQSGSLERDEIVRLFKELGLMPRSRRDAQNLRDIIHRIGLVDFQGFLRLIGRARAALEVQGDGALEAAIQRCEDAAHHVPATAIASILESSGLVPSSLEQQQTVSSIMREVDADGRGFFVAVQVRRVVHRIRERFQRLKLIKERELAQSYGMSERDFTDFRVAFDELDQDGSGTLDQDEVKDLLRRMRKLPATDAELVVCFHHLDRDGSGSLNFMEFLEMVKMLRDRDGVFASEAQPVTTLARLPRTDLFLLLDCFGIPVCKARGFDTQALVKKASELLAVLPESNLSAALGIATLSDLFQTARLHFEFKTEMASRASHSQGAGGR